jgi:hypothetical protein
MSVMRVLRVLPVSAISLTAVRTLAAHRREDRNNPHSLRKAKHAG